jgi:hypothetical protein
MTKSTDNDCDIVIERQFARLAEQAGKYIGAMSAPDREKVLTLAIECARISWEQFGPPKRNLLDYWDGCLHYALGTQRSWRVRRFDRWETWHTREVKLEAFFK